MWLVITWLPDGLLPSSVTYIHAGHRVKVLAEDANLPPARTRMNNETGYVPRRVETY